VQKNLCYPIKFAKGEIVYDTDKDKFNEGIKSDTTLWLFF